MKPPTVAHLFIAAKDLYGKRCRIGEALFARRTHREILEFFPQKAGR